MRSPAYLIQSRHNIFYFRVVIPPEIRKRFPGTPTEVRRSLGTREVKAAIRLARKMSVVTDEVFTRVMNTPNIGQSFYLTIQHLKLGLLELNGIELDADKPGDLDLLDSVVRRLSAGQPSLPSASVSSTSLLSEVIAVYCDEQVRLGNWTSKTEQENKGIYNRFQEIVGDQPFASLGYLALRSYKETLFKLPANLNKLPAFRGKTIEEVISMKPVPMGVNTVNKQLTRISALFEWAARQGHTDRNYARGMGVKRKDKRDDEEREVFTDAQIATLKGAVVGAKVKFPHRRWVPLIGMYSGLRLEEICQLDILDIGEVAGIPVFDINDESGKRLKTKNSKRTIPVHPELVRLGLLDYVAEQRSAGAVKLFPELKKSRDGYGQSVSRWFIRFRKKLGIDRQFHSLRHTVATRLREADVPLDLIADILGHARSDLETGRYAKEASVRRKCEALSKLCYDVAKID